MSYLDAFHWEAGEEHSAWLNILGSNQPVSDGPSVTGTIGGAYSKRIVFDGSDNFEAQNVDIYTRAASTTPMLIGMAMQIDDLSLFDEMSFYLQVDGTSSDGYIGWTIESNGGITIRVGTSDGASFDNGASVGAAPAGTFVEGIRNYISLRVVADPSSGEIQLAVNNTTHLDLTGINTWDAPPGSPATSWGWGAYLSSAAGASSEPLIIDDHVLADDMAAPFTPKIHAALVPTGVTADNDGTVFGGAGDAALATDEIPGTSADGFTLDVNGDIQGLSMADFDAGAAGAIAYVQVFGQMGDTAAGSETVRVNVNDGTSETTGTSLGMSADFAVRELTALDEASPSAGGWDDTKLDAMHIELERTA